MFDKLNIQSHRGLYSVSFDNKYLSDNMSFTDGQFHYLVDSNVAQLFKIELGSILENPNTIIIEAVEDNKSIEKVIPVIDKLVKNKVRRGHVLVAIGGGIIQDITCFIASTLLRGLPWHFIPTTLLAQADSCIGSKSSINLGSTKNILGTFNPPQKIIIDTNFLETLEKKEIFSGIGEIIKVLAIQGVNSFESLAEDYELLLTDKITLLKYIREALFIKKKYIEEDEFDRGIRNIFNYGHSFGHAIESATNYKIPHGIAVTIGMDLANYVSVARGLLPKHHYERMHLILHKNYKTYASVPIGLDEMLSALKLDKKNTDTMLGLILPVGDNAEIKRVDVSPDIEFYAQCSQFLLEMNI